MFTAIITVTHTTFAIGKDKLKIGDVNKYPINQLSIGKYIQTIKLTDDSRYMVKRRAEVTIERLEDTLPHNRLIDDYTLFDASYTIKEDTTAIADDMPSIGYW